jgi:hypothetical protein
LIVVAIGFGKSLAFVPVAMRSSTKSNMVCWELPFAKTTFGWSRTGASGRPVAGAAERAFAVAGVSKTMDAAGLGFVLGLVVLFLIAVVCEILYRRGNFPS